MNPSTTKSLAGQRSARLLSVLADYERVIVVMHDNPDPDAIAAGWALVVLIREKLHREARLIGGGEIIRAENRHMITLLEPPIELVNDIDVPHRTAAVLVDCGAGAGNQLLAKENIQPVAVVDHHPLQDGLAELPFEDVRPEVAASASIAAGYLREQQVEPNAALATALVYAMRTETRGSQTYHSRLDRSVLPWLTERADPSLLAEIENAPLSRAYFGDLVLALQNSFTYDDAAFCLLPRAAGPEIVGEVADLLIRCEGVRRVLCAAVWNGDAVLSVRTQTPGDDAARLVRETLDGLGHGGGHAHRAGGKIPAVGTGPKLTGQLEDRLRSRWLAACRIRRQRGSRLVARREIVENL